MGTLLLDSDRQVSTNRRHQVEEVERVIQRRDVGKSLLHREAEERSTCFECSERRESGREIHSPEEAVGRRQT